MTNIVLIAATVLIQYFPQQQQAPQYPYQQQQMYPPLAPPVYQPAPAYQPPPFWQPPAVQPFQPPPQNNMTCYRVGNFLNCQRY